MTESAKDLLAKIALGEGSVLELKEVRVTGDRVLAPPRDSLADECAAFANAKGGVCLLGVQDVTREVSGIPREHLDPALGFQLSRAKRDLV
jgi:predicted HTH transcriptional regulator